MEHEATFTLLPEWQRIFPAGVTASDRRTSDPLIVFEEEVDLTGNMVPKRRKEFLTGRTCARLALRSLGIEDSPLLIAPNRSPLWPPGIVGSISHSADYCIAVAGRIEQFAGIGIDVEVSGSVTPDIAQYIATREELEKIPEAVDDPATKIFCIKESIFKCVNPVTGVFLDFLDVEVGLFSDDSFKADILNSDSAIQSLEGRWAQNTRFVAALGSVPG